MKVAAFHQGNFNSAGIWNNSEPVEADRLAQRVLLDFQPHKQLVSSEHSGRGSGWLINVNRQRRENKSISI